MPEVHRVRVQHPRPAEEVRVVHLERQRLPAAGRAAREHARPRLPDHPEMLLEIRNELLQECIAVRAVVRGIHGVRVVEVRRRVLERHGDHAREIGSAPRPIELEPGFARAAREARRPLPGGFGAAVGREPERGVEIEVPLVVHGRIATDGIRVVPARQQHRRAEIDGTPPPRREQLTLNLDVPDPLRVGRQLDGREHPRELEPDRVGSGGIEMHLPDRAHEIPRRLVELLALPLIVVQPQRMPVGAVELRVHVEQPLHVVVARGDLLEARHRIAEGGAVDHPGRARHELGDVDAEERGAIALVADLEARLDVVVPRHEHVHASGHGRAAERHRHRDLDPRALGGDLRRKGERDGGDRGDDGETQGQVLERARYSDLKRAGSQDVERGASGYRASTSGPAALRR